VGSVIFARDCQGGWSFLRGRKPGFLPRGTPIVYTSAQIWLKKRSSPKIATENRNGCLQMLKKTETVFSKCWRKQKRLSPNVEENRNGYLQMLKKQKRLSPNFEENIPCLHKKYLFTRSNSWRTNHNYERSQVIGFVLGEDYV
jgi:hypothetical protein